MRGLSQAAGVVVTADARRGVGCFHRTRPGVFFVAARARSGVHHCDLTRMKTRGQRKPLGRVLALSFVAIRATGIDIEFREKGRWLFLERILP